MSNHDLGTLNWHVTTKCFSEHMPIRGKTTFHHCLSYDIYVYGNYNNVFGESNKKCSNSSKTYDITQKCVCVFDDYPKLVWRLLLLFKWHKYFKMHGQQCKLDYGILNRILWYCTRNVAEFVYNIVTVMAEHDQVEHKMTGK